MPTWTSNDFFPGTKRQYITETIYWRAAKHWGMCYGAGEGHTRIGGDRSGCLERINDRDYCRPPIVVSQRIYFLEGNDQEWISSVHSYPNGLSSSTGYFWELYTRGMTDDIERYDEEEEMELRVISLFSKLGEQHIERAENRRRLRREREEFAAYQRRAQQESREIRDMETRSSSAVENGRRSSAANNIIPSQPVANVPRQTLEPPMTFQPLTYNGTVNYAYGTVDYAYGTATSTSAPLYRFELNESGGVTRIFGNSSIGDLTNEIEVVYNPIRSNEGETTPTPGEDLRDNS